MRLIDADALTADYIVPSTSTGTGNREYVSLWQILNAPTIEQKTGHWVKVHGYFTPGGDPVWACSECGKGIHVYGIEHGTYGSDIADHQWVACPNCGADMRGENEA